MVERLFLEVTGSLEELSICSVACRPVISYASVEGFDTSFTEERHHNLLRASDWCESDIFEHADHDAEILNLYSGLCMYSVDILLP